MTKKILIDEAIVRRFVYATAMVIDCTQLEDWQIELHDKAGADLAEALADAALREALEVNNKGVNALAEHPAPSQYGSPELQAMIVARAIEKGAAEQPDYSICPACGGMASDPIVPVEARQQAVEPLACDKDPRGCWNVRCQLVGVCKNIHPAPTNKGD